MWQYLVSGLEIGIDRAQCTFNCNYVIRSSLSIPELVPTLHNVFRASVANYANIIIF